MNTECDEVTDNMITQEMVEAGVYAYSGKWLGLIEADPDTEKEMVCAVFKAMYRLLKKPS